MVGASANPLRPSYFVFRYLNTHGFDVRPVNPAYADIDGI
ncbi:MAG: CoA-binding protein, partial [Candidatus Eremiobacteraeota bacterium]|nr:CoA-binding protein [Candidatus Eremiobacteraeota bacterium]